MADLRQAAADVQGFNEARGWTQYHQPRSLILALVGEVGELAEVAQWRTDEQLHSDPAIRELLEAEIADVQLYLLNLCHSLGVDLARAVEEKIASNEGKHPVEASQDNPYGGDDR